MKRVLILTECGSKIGFGHLMRCRSIALALQSYGAAVDFFLHDDRGNPSVEEATFKGAWFETPATVQVTASSFEAILIDSFFVDVTFVTNAGLAGLKIFIIDDYPRRDYSIGTIIDWTVGSENYGYPEKKPNVKYLLGSSWCALRPAFCAPYYRSFPSNIFNVLITFGGSDIRDLSFRVAQMTLQSLPLAHVHVVLGGIAVNRQSNMMLRSLPKVTLYVNCSDIEMCRLMDGADIAICGGGQTLYEMASRGLPSITISLIENQNDDIRGFSEKGFGETIGSWDADNLAERLFGAFGKLANQYNRKLMAENGQSLVDGLGAKRIAEVMLA